VADVEVARGLRGEPHHHLAHHGARQLHELAAGALLLGLTGLLLWRRRLGPGLGRQGGEGGLHLRPLAHHGPPPGEAGGRRALLQLPEGCGRGGEGAEHLVVRHGDGVANKEGDGLEDRVEVGEGLGQLGAGAGEGTEGEGEPVVHLGLLQDAASIQCRDQAGQAPGGAGAGGGRHLARVEGEGGGGAPPHLHRHLPCHRPAGHRRPHRRTALTRRQNCHGGRSLKEG